MAERRCPVCGRRFNPKTGTHTYCTRICRERARIREPRPGQGARYGYAHQQLRRRVARLVASGAAVCARCGLPIHPGEPWDLDHADGAGPHAYLGPSHAGCNRATAKPRGPVERPPKPAKGFWRWSDDYGWIEMSRDW